MAQKFIGLDDAAKQLGVDKDQLNDLREAGKLRAYRDGASWKFRTDEIDKLAKDGLPDVAGESSLDFTGLTVEDDSDESELSLDLDDSDEVKSEPTQGEPAAAAPDDDSDGGLELGDLEIDDDVGESIELSEEPAPKSAATSDAELAALEEPTVPAEEPEAAELEVAEDEGSDLVLDTEGSGDDAESILLSEAEMGDTPDRPPSTIIGRSELELDDGDLELASNDNDAAGKSDVMLAEPSGVLSSESSGGSEVIPGGGQPPSGKFEDLEELEIDLEAESSRILEAEDVAAAAKAAESSRVTDSGPESDLSLAPTDSDPGLAGQSNVTSDESDKDESNVGLTGISSLDVDSGGSAGSLSGLSSIELADDEDDDFVLGDSGSDVSLSGADSGINLSPSDSGLALDDAVQQLGGSAIGSSLDLGAIGSDIGGSGIAGSDIQPMGSAAMGSGELASSEDFLLTPLDEEGGDDEEDSSQIIALEAVGDDSPGGDDSLVGDPSGMEIGGPEMAGAAAGAGAVSMVPEAQFSVGSVVLLTCCVGLLAFCGVMMVDVLRNMWAWNQPFDVNSSLIDGLLGLFGIS